MNQPHEQGRDIQNNITLSSCTMTFGAKCSPEKKKKKKEGVFTVRFNEKT